MLHHLDQGDALPGVTNAETKQLTSNKKHFHMCSNQLLKIGDDKIPTTLINSPILIAILCNYDFLLTVKHSLIKIDIILS